MLHSCFLGSESRPDTSRQLNTTQTSSNAVCALWPLWGQTCTGGWTWWLHANLQAAYVSSRQMDRNRGVRVASALSHFKRVCGKSQTGGRKYVRANRGSKGGVYWGCRGHKSAGSRSGITTKILSAYYFGTDRRGMGSPRAFLLLSLWFYVFTRSQYKENELFVNKIFTFEKEKYKRRCNTNNEV